MSFRTRYEEKTCTPAKHADKQGAEVFSLLLEMTKRDWTLIDKLSSPLHPRQAEIPRQGIICLLAGIVNGESRAGEGAAYQAAF